MRRAWEPQARSGRGQRRTFIGSPRACAGIFACGVLLSACGILDRTEPEPVSETMPGAVLGSAAEAAAESGPSRAIAAGAPADPEPVPPSDAAPRAPVPAPPAASARILVLSASDAARYRQVAAALERSLGDQLELVQMSLDDPGTPASVRERRGDWDAAIAIGLDAAEAVDTELDVPTVFCQIFDYAPLLARRESLFGVEAQPPLALQLRSWRRLAPGATAIAALVADGETELADRARRAAAENGLELKLEFAASDREVLYRFRRLALSVDAFWLLPNSDILSPRVLREVLDYAQSRGIHSIVFDDTLLDWGGLLSVGSNADDVAAAVTRVVEAFVNDDAAALERVTPLTKADVRVNHDLAAALGITAPAGASRVRPQGLAFGP